MNKDRNILFDLIRGTSAIIVLISHLRNVMFEDFNTIIEKSNYLVSFFYFITSLGHDSVIVFFVLSGYFVGGSVISKKENFKFSPYFLARISRIWTVLLPSLLITFIIDKFIFYHNPSIINGDYLSVLHSGPESNYSISLINFFSNTFFLQTIFSPVYGTNGPLWSLSNEFWYYILFPTIFIFLIKNKHKLFYKLINLCVIIIIVGLIHNKIEGFIIWMLGVLVFWVYSKEYVFKNIAIQYLLIILSSLLWGFSIVFSKINSSDNLLISNDLLIGISFSIFLIAVKNSKLFMIKNIFLKKFSLFLSEISFSMYLVHFPIVILIFSFFYKDNKQELSFYNFIIFTLITFLLIIISYIFWFLFERKTADFKNLLSAAFNKLKF